MPPRPATPARASARAPAPAASSAGGRSATGSARRTLQSCPCRSERERRRAVRRATPGSSRPGWATGTRTPRRPEHGARARRCRGQRSPPPGPARARCSGLRRACGEPMPPGTWRGRPPYGTVGPRCRRQREELVGADPTPDEWSELLTGRVRGTGELSERYGPLVAAGPRLALAQLGQSLDGFIASRTGDACFVTGEEDRIHLHRLRALVDAVIVGVGTVVADDCRLTVRAVTGPEPVRVVLDPAARAPLTAQVFSGAGPGALWLVAEDASVPDPLPEQVEVVRLDRGPDGGFSPGRVLAALADRGLDRVLVEGGGVTVSRFLAAGALDRLLVTTAPVLVGDGVPGIRFEGRERIAEALRPPARRFVLGHDTCVELDLSRR